MMSNLDQNIFFWDASAETFTEVTKELNNFRSGTKTLTFDADDRLYFATNLPFNHRYFQITQPNSASATNLIVEYYGADEWITPSRTLDYTESLAGATFGQSGILQFIPDNQNTIANQSDTDVMDDNFKDHAPNVYNMFWCGIGFDAVTTIGFSYIGQLFSANDEEIYQQYPLLNEPRFLDQWEAGKTDWLDQRILATNAVCMELERRAITIDRNQVLDTARLNESTIHYAAMTMFSGLGVDRFEKEIKLAGKRYSDSMFMEKYNVDLNANASLDQMERQVSVSMRSR